MNYLNDHQVAYLSEPDIAQIASEHRADALQRTMGNHVIAAKYILRNLISIFGKNGNILKLKVFEISSTETRLAFVEFSSFTLNVQQNIWHNALAGHPHANFILAHELGHILLHDHHAQAFLIDQTKRNSFIVDEESAEWQANTFASHYLLPFNELKLDSEPSVLSMRFGIPVEYAADRIFNNWNQKKKSGAVNCTSEQCSNCGKMSVIQVGNKLVCTICPPTHFIEETNNNYYPPSSLPDLFG